MANIVVSPVIQMAKRDEVKKRFEEVFGNPTKASSFIASMINVVNGNDSLKRCVPDTVMGAAMIAAALDLPIDPNLGFAYMIPYGDKAQLQLGYKSFVQLAMRSGQYADLNYAVIYEDELDYYNPITGKIKLTERDNWKQRNNGEDTKIVGYYASFELHNGFKKEIYMTKKEVEIHAKKYSKGYASTRATNIWKSDFDSMALKTVLKRIISKWGILSVDMQKAVKYDQATVNDYTNIEDITYNDNNSTKDVSVNILDEIIEGDFANVTE